MKISTKFALFSYLVTPLQQWNKPWKVLNPSLFELSWDSMAKASVDLLSVLSEWRGWLAGSCFIILLGGQPYWIKLRVFNFETLWSNDCIIGFTVEHITTVQESSQGFDRLSNVNVRHQPQQQKMWRSIPKNSRWKDKNMRVLQNPTKVKIAIFSINQNRKHFQSHSFCCITRNYNSV